MQQHPRMNSMTVHCNFTDYDWCLEKSKTKDSRVAIDKGPDGGRCPQLIERMFAAAPEQKLIFLFRHPLDRLYSHYQHQVRSPVTRYNDTFERWFQQNVSCFDAKTLVTLFQSICLQSYLLTMLRYS
eukprot:TRINITY_DN1535_c0_g1_i2.p1 TRINITY_DN1535_c0_g1~~TRINITY_DN1535_c0_g1_i2.p1  ORF type:complete len:127 (-),score=10.18 TRINITY_DN1535_c0_g1_i2:447-827(-)